ncbi:MAG: hypothetical protein IJT97_02485, partial [Bacteroidaceae bacterium]|nr:hypothetical protein [Bacteroidaceae bacterium]
MRKFFYMILFCCATPFAVAQENRNDIFKEIRHADKVCNFTNKASFVKSGDGRVTRFTTMLPIPKSNEYQDISNLTFTDGKVLEDYRYGNRVLFVDLKKFRGNEYTVSYTFDVRTTHIHVNTSLITNFRNYDPNSEPCRKHLGDRGKYIVTRHPYV